MDHLNVAQDLFFFWMTDIEFDKRHRRSFQSFTFLLNDVVHIMLTIITDWIKSSRDCMVWHDTTRLARYTLGGLENDNKA